MLRRLSALLHRYLGLAAGLLLVPIGLTGAVLVFEEEIDLLLEPALHRTEPRGEAEPLDAVVAAVRAAYPEAAIGRMELPGAPDETYEAVLRDGRQVYVDPYSAGILGTKEPGEGVTGFLFEVHVALLAGERGKAVVGVVGLVLFVLGVTGLVLWWRGRRRLRQSLTIRRGASARRLNYDLHGVVGFYATLPLLVVAFTGAGLVFFGAFSEAAHRLTGTPLPPPAPASTPRPDAAPPSFDDLLRRAQAALPESRPARIDFPAVPEAAYRIRLRHPEELHPIGLSMVYLDRYDGAVLRVESALEVPAARRFGYAFYPLHIGSYGGLGVRVLYALLGLLPALLVVTGVVIWAERRRKKRRRGSAAAHDRAARHRAPRRREVSPGVRPPGASAP